MRTSYRWLQEYVATTTPPLVLAERFQMTSSALEGTEDWTEHFRDVVTAQVLSVSAHPSSEHLHLVEVKIGRTKRSIVCGAANVAAGQVVAVALPGATLHPLQGEPVTLTKRTIRGVVSDGMICSADELGLPVTPAVDGIWVLDPTTPTGIPLATALGLDDLIIDLEVTPNRPDLLCYVGLAREAATFEKRRLLEPPITPLEQGSHTLPSQIKASITPGAACTRLSALAFTVRSVEPSPWWLQARLIVSGIRPINSIVDVTNYVMLELGQPLHAYDFAAVSKGSTTAQLEVVSASGTETLATLDNQTREAATGDVLICSNGTPVGFAGIMGGKTSGVTPASRHIVLEAAHFRGPAIRRTSRRLGLRSEASSRFEKGIDPELTVTALKRAAYLLQKIGAAEPSSQLVDIRTHTRESKNRLQVTTGRIQEVLGVHITIPEAKGILQKLGFQVTGISKTSLSCLPPSWRADVEREEDVLEELVRIWGYERVPLTLPNGLIKSPQPNPQFEIPSTIRHLGAQLGYTETVHLPFANSRELQKVHLTPQQAVALANPLSQEQTHLIPTHLIPFLNTVAASQQYESSRLCEVGRVFTPPHSERYQTSFLLRGNEPAEQLFREGKTFIEAIARQGGHLTSADVTYSPLVHPDQTPYFESSATQTVYLQGKIWGRLGLVHDRTVSAYKIRRARQIIFGELALAVLHEVRKDTWPIYQALPTFPEVERDTTLVVAETISWQQVAETLANFDHAAILKHWRFVSTYQGAPLAKTEKSYTIHFTYGAPDRTLTEDEVASEHSRIENFLQQQLHTTRNS